jgi:TPR repeat protein
MILAALHIYEESVFDVKKSSKWLFNALRLNNRHAILFYQLNNMEESDKDYYKRMIPTLESYAENNNEMALFILGFLNFHELLVHSDQNRAIEYLKLSASMGNPFSLIIIKSLDLKS